MVATGAGGVVVEVSMKMECTIIVLKIGDGATVADPELSRGATFEDEILTTWALLAAELGALLAPPAVPDGALGRAM